MKWYSDNEPEAKEHKVTSEMDSTSKYRHCNEALGFAFHSDLG